MVSKDVDMARVTRIKNNARFREMILSRDDFLNA